MTLLINGETVALLVVAMGTMSIKRRGNDRVVEKGYM